MKLYVYIAVFVSILIALAQIGNALVILLLATFSIGVMTILAASIMDLQKPLTKKRRN